MEIDRKVIQAGDYRVLYRWLNSGKNLHVFFNIYKSRFLNLDILL